VDAILRSVEKEHLTNNSDIDFSAGDTVSVAFKIQEGNKSRIQLFKGVVIQRSGTGTGSTFTVRKSSGNGVFVERIFPLHSPLIDKIEIDRKGKVRRAKIFYIRDLTGKATRIKEQK